MPWRIGWKYAICANLQPSVETNEGNQRHQHKKQWWVRNVVLAENDELNMCARRRYIRCKMWYNNTRWMRQESMSFWAHTMISPSHRSQTCPIEGRIGALKSTDTNCAKRITFRRNATNCLFLLLVYCDAGNLFSFHGIHCYRFKTSVETEH